MACATLSNLSTKEASNFIQLCRLLVDVGSRVLREIFDSKCLPGNLHTVLADPQNKEKLLSLRKKRVLSPSQWFKLYPTCQSRVSSRELKISLLLLLWRNIFGLTFPTSSSDKFPPVTDTSPEADITRIKVLRDGVYSHASSGSVDDSTFSSYWNDIKDIFLRLGGTHYQYYIDDIKLNCVDADLEEYYQELLSKWFKDEDCIADKSSEETILKKTISDNNSWETETEVMLAQNESAQSDNASPPKLSKKIPSMSDLPHIYYPWKNVELPVDILLLTVEDCEFRSCFAFLKEPFKSYHNSIGYVFFGCMGDDQGRKVKIALMRCSKGPDVPRGSLSVSKDAISLLRPKATFSVGACSGLNSRKVKLGDVVVCAKLITAAHQTPPSSDIGNLIRHVADGWKAPLQNADEYNIKVHCDGVVLSISEANKDMIGQYPKAIAVEMEGGGVFAAAHDFKTEWAVVKGIKDFANETSSEEWEQIACVMAASVVANILSDPVIFQDWPHFHAGTNELPSEGKFDMF
ncbi:uncharacterized protein LOC111346976 [Stylophora pistillata]|uniref:uncharacterized protein LOC111346976 n=1 Tax=Stylophora pistillata TaxID=50429 RepID=UPI000C04DC75|nr:uncharacterized protein LOC111346976 [Stylophora pistillata]